MSEFIHYVWEKHLLFILVLVGHDKRTFSLQVKKIKDITPIVQCVKDVSTISFPCILLLYGILIAFSKLVLTVNTQPATACWGLAMEALEQYVGVFKMVVMYMYVYMCMCVYACMYIVCVYVFASICIYVCVFMYICTYVCLWVYIYIYMYVCMCVCIYICVCICVYICIICIDTSYLSILLGLGGTLFWCYFCWFWASKCLLCISDFNDKISFN